MGNKSVHENVLELLPWYINDSLGDRERDLVQVHLASCAECRRERDRLQAIGDLVREDDGVLPDYRFSMKKVMARIDEAERNRESTHIEPASHGLLSIYRDNWKSIAGVAAGLVMAVAIVAQFQHVASTDGEFRTLSNGEEAPAAGDSHRIALTFEQPIKAATMRQALIETRSNIISGPDEAGTYLIEVKIPDNQSESEYIESIRAIDGVQMASFEQH